MTRTIVKVDRTNQLNLLNDSPPVVSQKMKKEADTGRTFIAPNRKELFLGMTRMDHHLRQAGLLEPLEVAALLEQLTWHEFEARYAKTGRAPYAPQAMMGVILYGFMQGIHSLRGLERLARQDLGCMWITGGICPDHACLGRFILLHEASFSNGLFKSITRQALAVTKSNGQTLAGDGTIVEAACSYYQLLKEEAVRGRADEAKKQMAVGPLPKAKQSKVKLAIDTETRFDERKQARVTKGRTTDSLAISPIEPDAVVQPQKRKRGKAASYKPSILANDKRVITAHQIDPSAESRLIPELLDQSQRISGEAAQNLLLDGGYCHDLVIQTAIEKDINLLCPEGKTVGEPRGGKVYSKGMFQYHAEGDYYLCPAGQHLTSGPQGKKTYKMYRTSACQNCPLRTDCTKAKAGRRIRRLDTDEAKEALRQVMSHPKAQKAYTQRQAMVEPVFSYLKTVQGLTRFRRKGLSSVKIEFALHVLAYNLRLAIRAILVILWAFYTWSLALSHLNRQCRGIFLLGPTPKRM